MRECPRVKGTKDHIKVELITHTNGVAGENIGKEKLGSILDEPCCSAAI
jgi:hypothetical protein